MSEIGDTLKRLRTAAGFSQPEVAALFAEHGLPVHFTAISKWEKGNTQPNAEQLLLLCSLYDVRDLSEFGATEKLNQTGLQRLREYDSLLRGDKRFVVQKLHKIRLFDLPASAGLGNYADSDDFEEIEVPEDEVPNDADYCVRVSGDSMEPLYHDGEIVYVAECDVVSVGEVGIFALNGDVFIKRLGKGKLVSENKEYAPIVLREYDDVRTFGRVVG
jgi:phage repressor protein C with HTH and peptisase S24 domain